MSAILQTSLKKLPVATGGHGVYLTVIDPETGISRDIIDANSGAAVSAVGHGDEEIKQKMRESVDKVIYNYPAIVSNQPSEELATFLVNESNGAFEAAFFVGSGSEANENAMKIIRKYHVENGQPQRVKYISRKQSYHGFTLGALSIADHTELKGDYKAIILPETLTPKVSPVYPYRDMLKDETLEQYKDRLLAEIEEAFIKAGPETIAAFVTETVTGGTSGAQLPPPGYFDGIRDICHKYGALFFLDEVMCGLGRMGVYHSWERYMDGPGPDIQTNGKTLSSGYVTIASVLVSPKIMKLFKEKGTVIHGSQSSHSHSFNCQVALEVQKKIKRDGLVQNLQEVGTYFGEQMSKRLSKRKFVGDIRGEGGLWAIEFVKDKETKTPFPEEDGFTPIFTKKLYDNGVFTYGANGTIDGVLGDHALFAPAYSITKKEADIIVDALETTLISLESIL